MTRMTTGRREVAEDEEEQEGQREEDLDQLQVPAELVVLRVEGALGARGLEGEAVDGEELEGTARRLRPDELQLAEQRDGLHVREEDPDRADDLRHLVGVPDREVGVRGEADEEERDEAERRDQREHRRLAAHALVDVGTFDLPPLAEGVAADWRQAGAHVDVAARDRVEQLLPERILAELPRDEERLDGHHRRRVEVAAVDAVRAEGKVIREGAREVVAAQVDVLERRELGHLRRELADELVIWEAQRDEDAPRAVAQGACRRVAAAAAVAVGVAAGAREDRPRRAVSDLEAAPDEVGKLRHGPVGGSHRWHVPSSGRQPPRRAGSDWRHAGGGTYTGHSSGQHTTPIHAISHSSPPRGAPSCGCRSQFVLFVQLPPPVT